MNDSIKERLLAKINVNEETQCWEWTGMVNNHFGRIKIDGKPKSAHILSYNLFVGEIPEGHYLKQVCGDRLCVNPEHLTPSKKRGPNRVQKEDVKDRLLRQTKLNKETGCWEWTGARMHKRYGHISAFGKTLRTHRLSYELHVGDIPEGMCVLHKCDNTVCVNPDHLFLGTQAENMADKVAKGRQQAGAENPMAKLTEPEVVAIKRMLAKHYGVQPFLARWFGVNQSTIHMIAAGKNWRHVAA